VNNPPIIPASGDNLDVLEQQFWRYTREYEVRCAPTAAGAKAEAADVIASGGQVALFVLESELPDREIYPAIAKR
jgi:thioredoxin reductase (NADPH)